MLYVKITSPPQLTRTGTSIKTDASLSAKDLNRLAKYSAGLEEENHRLAERLEKREVTSSNRAANNTEGNMSPAGRSNKNQQV
jgi:hypothetical protein